MASDLVKNCKGLSGLSACKCMLVAKSSACVTWGTLTCRGCWCRYKKFLVASYCVCSYNLF